MLTIPFSHRFYAKCIEFNGIPLDMPTRLLGYTITRHLSDDFRKRDTKFWRGTYGIESRAEYFKLGPGPYLILFLATDTGNRLIFDSRYAPGVIHWTTVRRPWCRVRRCCSVCRNLDASCPNCAHWSQWVPVPAIVPKKYRQARGQLVRIVYKPEEAQ